MSTCFSRSALSVNDDMPSSYFLAAMPGRMPSNALFWNSTSRPSFWPTALPRSTSMPMIVVPSVSTNSLGAYDASEPTTILPSDAIVGRHQLGQRLVLLHGRCGVGARRPGLAGRRRRCRYRLPRIRRP